MRFFGLGFFMESSPPWALVITLKRFYVFYLPHGFIQRNVMSAQCHTARTPCPWTPCPWTPCPWTPCPWTPCPWTPWTQAKSRVAVPEHFLPFRSRSHHFTSAPALEPAPVSAQCDTAGTRCPRSVTLRGHGVLAV